MSAKRACHWIVAVGGVLAVLAVLYDRVVWSYWHGTINLEIVFLVADADTGRPVEGATVLVHQDSPTRGPSGEKWGEKFGLPTDKDGAARRVCHRLTGEHSSGLGFTNTWSVDLPSWFCWVTAPGYEPMEEPFVFNNAVHNRNVQRLDRTSARVSVNLAITKSKTR
jgi:hypothetical protein